MGARLQLAGRSDQGRCGPVEGNCRLWGRGVCAASQWEKVKELIGAGGGGKAGRWMRNGGLGREYGQLGVSG